MNDDPPTISSLNYLMAEDTEVLDSSTRNWRDVVNATNKMIIQETSLAEGEQTAQPTGGVFDFQGHMFRGACIYYL